MQKIARRLINATTSNLRLTRIQHRGEQIIHKSYISAMTSPKVVLITGGNNGIGYETVKALLQSKRPYHILVGSRSLEKGKRAIETLHKDCADATNTLELVQVDLTSDESIEKAFEQVKTSPGSIDVLINNAGSFVPQPPTLFTSIYIQN